MEMETVILYKRTHRHSYIAIRWNEEQIVYEIFGCTIVLQSFKPKFGSRGLQSLGIPACYALQETLLIPCVLASSYQCATVPCCCSCIAPLVLP
jgi:hypothetical protein